MHFEEFIEHAQNCVGSFAHVSFLVNKVDYERESFKKMEHNII